MDAVANRHPKALPYLFLTEMWERFGFYVVQGLLVLYMTEYFGFSDNRSYTILGVFTALAYISPLAGGFIANRYLGYTTSVIWGGLFLVIGYALFALPDAETFLYPALATIIVGNGLFKPNISSLLGTQYSENDPRRDSGFTIFYIGINLGSFLAGISSGYIKENFGWHTSFALTSIGLIIGLITFSLGLKYLINRESEKQYSAKFKVQLVICFLLAIGAITYLLNFQSLAEYLLPAAGVFLFIGLIVLTQRQTPEARKKMMVLNILIFSSIVFWMLFFQMFYSANLFVERLVDKNIFGIHLTTTVFYASEAIFIILLGPIFAWFWHALGKKNKNPRPISKYVLGIIFTGIGFLILCTSTFFPDANEMINPGWVFSSYLLITVGELLISPIGLSAVTLLAPPHLVGLLMGIWFAALGFGGLFAGIIAKLSSIPDTVTSNADKLIIYQNAFLTYACIAFVVAIILGIGHISLKRYLPQN